MSILKNIKRWIGMLFSGKAKEVFDVKGITDKAVIDFINNCANVYKGSPDWLSDNVKTINVARTICQETARLVMLATGIHCEGSPRADWMQEQIDIIYPKLRSWTEFACAYGNVILKPSIDSVDLILPNQFMVTSQKNNKVDGAVFLEQKRNDKGDKWYTRLEYHRFLDNGLYMITNKCFISASKNSLDNEIAIEDTPWNGINEEVAIQDLKKPLFAVLSMPSANHIEETSALSLPMFSDALEELKDLDIAYSRNAEEIFDSQRIVLLDADKLLPSKGTQNNTLVQKSTREQMELPKFVRNVMGNGQSDFYQEINPTMNTMVRLEGINALLSQIGYKCGFSNGYFVFNQKTGMVTATQIESDDRRTLQMIKDIRDQLQACLDDLFYALDKLATLYELAPEGEYEVNYDFGDLTYNYQEDKATWWNYVQTNRIPFWRYLVKFEGMTEEEAKELVEEQTMQTLENNELFKDE